MMEAARRGIAVRVVRNDGDRTIFEHAFGLLLAAARDFAPPESSNKAILRR
jgi:phosphoglycerate dehydrogenase-like enzyme